MKITAEIFEVGGANLTSPDDAAIYLIQFGNQAALVDSGCGHATRKLIDNIKRCGVEPARIKYLLLTHCHYDHTGGAAELKSRLGLEIVAHQLDAVYLEAGDNRVTAASWYGESLAPLQVDRKLTGPKEQLLLGGVTIEAVHVPGHSPGSVVYWTMSEGLRVLFAQDVHGPLDPSLLSNPAEYEKSLEVLLSIDADILCEGHYGVYRGKAEVADFISQFMKS